MKLIPASDILLGGGRVGVEEWRHRSPPSGNTGFFRLLGNSETQLFSQQEAMLCHTAAQEKFLKAAKVMNTNYMPKLQSCIILTTNLNGIY